MSDEPLKLIPPPEEKFSRVTKADLPSKVDHYNGIIIDHTQLPQDRELFSIVLQSSIEVWKLEERRGIWLQIPIESAELVPEAVSLGFVFHHAKPNHVVLTKWLPETPNTLPSYTTHFVGVGGFVVREIDSQKYVLVVKEKNGPVTSIWKIPGGTSDAGEDIAAVAVREVLEETGIQTEFECLLGFRQHHTAAFEQSDLYFVCYLKPLTFDIVVQESEIQDAKWMPIDEFIDLPYYKGVYKKFLELGRDKSNGTYEGLISETLPIVFRPGTNVIYHSNAKL